jgi:hypothetical protein
MLTWLASQPPALAAAIVAALVSLATTMLSSTLKYWSPGSRASIGSCRPANRGREFVEQVARRIVNGAGGLARA